MCAAVVRDGPIWPGSLVVEQAQRFLMLKDSDLVSEGLLCFALY